MKLIMDSPFNFTKYEQLILDFDQHFVLNKSTFVLTFDISDKKIVEVMQFLNKLNIKDATIKQYKNNLVLL